MVDVEKIAWQVSYPEYWSRAPSIIQHPKQKNWNHCCCTKRHYKICIQRGKVPLLLLRALRLLIAAAIPDRSWGWTLDRRDRGQKTL